MVGPPGAGKSLAASRLPSILPPLAAEEALEVARIASACGRLGDGRAGGRPFRSPHHTVSPAGLVGGGNPPGPGEATLAHRGVLFLDELCEFRRDTLEALRAPLETGWVSIARAGAWRQPALPLHARRGRQPLSLRARRGRPRVQLRAAGDARYQGRLSGALADRIDILAAIRQPSAAEIGGPAGRALGRGARAGRRRPRAPGHAARARPLQRRDDAGRGARVRARRGRRRAARRVLLAPPAQRSRPRPRAAAGADGRRPRRQRGDRPRADGAGPAAAAEGLGNERAERLSGCLRRARLLALLAPYIEKIATGAPGLALARTAAPLQRGSRRRGGAEDRGAGPRPGRGGAGEPSRRRLAAARCWACCRHDAAIRRACATPPTRPGR